MSASRGEPVKVAAAVFVILGFLLPTLVAESERGTICVLAQPAEFKPGVITPGAEYNPATLKFRIDQQAVVSWPHKESLKIEGLDMTEQHTVRVFSDGKQIQSARFRFSEYKAAYLCFFYDGYGGIQLGEAKHSVCKCK
jgi:hypothetical protein